MLAALLYGQEDLRLEQVADPTPDAGEVVIKRSGDYLRHGSECGVGGHVKMLRPPTLFGHEAAKDCSGKEEELGDQCS